MDYTDFSKNVLIWYSLNKRDLPWRYKKNEKKDPYKIWVSEVMLQQTTVQTVIPYYEKFIKKWPNIKKLASTNINEVLDFWSGLGYYRRARNLLACCKTLVKNHKSKLPNSIVEIKKLPGIGDYTANALLGLVYNEPRIAVDGNVKRVFSRNLNIKEKNIKFDKLIEKNKKKLFSTNRNADFVEALMECGALICKPKDPKCLACCLNKTCKYFKSDKKIKNIRNKMIKNKNYDIFCYINKKKQIALTKNNQISFLKNFNLPEIKEANSFTKDQNWKFLKNYKNSISNLKLNINLYYKFSNKLPSKYNWYSLKENKEFVPSFTKKIFKQVSTLF